MTLSTLRNVIVIGASYVGSNAATKLAAALPASHRVLLIEPHSHFHHLFAFPRFAVLPGHEHKAFVPYTSLFDDARHSVVQAKVLQVNEHSIVLDRAWSDPVIGTTAHEIAFDYLVLATGTRLPSPGSVTAETKVEGAAELAMYSSRIANPSTRHITIIGGGAVGVQMACDIKETYPDKTVVLVQSRDRVMPKFHPTLDAIVRKRFDELGVQLVNGVRATVPDQPAGQSAQGELPPFDITLTDGRTLSTQVVIRATGQLANNQLMADLAQRHDASLINPDNGFVRVKDTLQLKAPGLEHMFAVGDIADTGAHKAARPGMAQAEVATSNILALINGEEPSAVIERGPAAIHMSLGMRQNVLFVNPIPPAREPTKVVMRDDGADDMNVAGIWKRRGIQIRQDADYHL